MYRRGDWGELVTAYGTAKTKTSDRDKKKRSPEYLTRRDRPHRYAAESIINIAFQLLATVPAYNLHVGTFIVEIIIIFRSRRKDFTIPMCSPITIPFTSFVLFIQTVQNK